MAVQNALVQLSLHGSPTTAVMTTNLTRFIMDAGEAILGHQPAEVAEARHRAKLTWPVIIGFIVGAGLGATCFAAAGLKSLGLSAGLALLALILSPEARPSDGRAVLGQRYRQRSIRSLPAKCADDGDSREDD
jgi:uncharacterized membrane protein YoaK (UPF0700 family)